MTGYEILEAVRAERAALRARDQLLARVEHALRGVPEVRTVPEREVRGHVVKAHTRRSRRSQNAPSAEASP